MKTKELYFNYPEELVATHARARGDSRLFLIPKANSNFKEITWSQFFDLFQKGDLLVLNNTKVFKARLMLDQKKEIFFLKTLNSSKHWQVLTKGLKAKPGKEISLPGELNAQFIKTGLPAEIEIDKEIDLGSYFQKWGHVPLPPYILSLRKEHSDLPEDVERYQTLWAQNEGSVAAPTASLHFTEEHLEELKKRGVEIEYITLHVGAGTFLPIDVEDIKDFKIHSEWISVLKKTVEKIAKIKAEGFKVWACGTTVMRALETAGLKEFTGETELFIKPGYKFKVVDALLTNFHQPESSLLLLVSAFAGHDQIMAAYKEAVKQKFRLFSYGDLTVIA